jgi:hypothetical protein
MATRYWVGGNGNWDATSTANWSDTSGGAGGASAPTSLDDVVFDANSDSGAPFTVTITGTTSAPAACNNFDANTGSALDQAMTLSVPLASAILQVSGSFTLPTTNFSFSAPGNTGTRIYFVSSNAGNTITSNAVSFGNVGVQFNGTGSWVLGSALAIGSSSGGGFNILQGSFDTANHNLTLPNFTSDNANTRSITLGSSTVTITRANAGFNLSDSTNLTF